jgi:glycosyltransferase involved in cell wall biosynthesis
MKILFITGLFPTKKNPLCGIFITRRLLKLKELGIQFKVITYAIKESYLYFLYKKILKKSLNIVNYPIISGSFNYDVIEIRHGLLDRIFFNQLGLLKIVNSIVNYIAFKNFDIIHVHWVYPQGYYASLVSKKTGIPLIISAHGDDIRINPFEYPRIIPKMLSAFNVASLIFFTDIDLLRVARGFGYNGDNYLITPTAGVDRKKFSHINKNEVRKKLKLPIDNTILIGYIGMLTFVKGADLLPEVFFEAYKQNQAIKFIVIGEGEMKKDIEKQCYIKNINILFIPYVSPDDMPLWMNALDILILPSRSEGLPNVVMEAQSCGCPVVGSDAGGIPYAIGYGGISVKQGSDFEKRFADAIIQITLNFPDPLLVRNSTLKFDSDIVIETQIEAYKEIIKKSNNRFKNPAPGDQGK